MNIFIKLAKGECYFKNTEFPIHEHIISQFIYIFTFSTLCYNFWHHMYFYAMSKCFIHFISTKNRVDFLIIQHIATDKMALTQQKMTFKGLKYYSLVFLTESFLRIMNASIFSLFPLGIPICLAIQSINIDYEIDGFSLINTLLRINLIWPQYVS